MTTTFTIPDRFAANLGGAMVHRAAEVIMDTQIVPAWLFQFEELWDTGIKYGYDGTFWQAVADHRPITHHTLKKAGLV